MKGCFVCEKGGRLPYVFGAGRMEKIREKVAMCGEIINMDNLQKHRDFLRDCEVMFCTWDMVPFSAAQLREYFPNLRVLFYAAASVRYFAEPFLEQGVAVLSAWRVMAKPVAQFTVSLITLAGKGALLTLQKYRREGYDAANGLTREIYPGNYGTKVGILGAGAIGSLVVKMLRDYGVQPLVYDPFLPKARAEALGVTLCGLEEIFSQCQVVSNHLANNKETEGILNYDLFRRMKDTAAFINTGRGAQVVEEDLVRALKEKPLRTAFLDVTFPEPASPEHPFWEMDNIFLFPHIAGFARDEVLLFSDFMIGQLERYLAKEPFDDCRVTMEMLKTMA